MRENKKRYKSLAIILALILLPLGAFTLGYFFSNKQEEKKVTHTLKVDGDITGSITETVESDAEGIVPGDEVGITVGIDPKSSTSSLLRVKIEPYWMKGQSQSNLPTDNIQVIYEDNKVSDSLIEGSWYKEGDYLYYIGQVKDKTDNLELVKGIKFLATTGGQDNDSDSNANSYQDKGIGLKVTMEMIQCSDYAYQSKWNDINENGDIYNKLKELSTEAKKI